MLRSRLPEITVEIEVIVNDRIERGAEAVKDRAEQRLEPHRLTGRLQEATHVQEEPEGFYVVAGGKTEDGDDVFWGHMLEHGTSHSPPYPFLVPSLEENRSRIVDDVRDGLRGL